MADTVTSGRFDALVGTSDTADRRAAPVDPTSLEDLFDAEPSAPRASLATVAAIFLAISVAQVGVLAAAILNYDIATVRVLLGFVLALPAVLYGFVAAWDHRQLVATGEGAAPPWEWAIVFPPIYLALRFTRARGSRGATGAALGWAIAQLGVTIAFAAFACIAVVLAPVQAAVAVPTVPASGVSGAYIVEVVEAGWAEDGVSGSAACADPVSQAPGTAVACTGTYDGAPLEFTAQLGDTAAGDEAVIVTRWSTSA